MVKLIGFDADDTLWENENYFFETQQRYADLLKEYASKEEILEILHQTQVKNIGLFGYGIKSFTLSMMEAALDLSGQRLSAKETTMILDLGKRMLQEPVHLLKGVKESLELLKGGVELIAITKGDLLDQNRKMEKSGLMNYFSDVIVVSEKNEQTYREILQRKNVRFSDFLMVGNSVKSDILPVLQLGGWGAHIPFHYTWQHEVAEIEPDNPRFRELKDFTELLDLVCLREKVGE